MVDNARNFKCAKYDGTTKALGVYFASQSLAALFKERHYNCHNDTWRNDTIGDSPLETGSMTANNTANNDIQDNDTQHNYT